MKNPGTGVISPETDRDEIALGIADVDDIPDNRVVEVETAGVGASHHIELMLYT